MHRYMKPADLGYRLTAIAALASMASLILNDHRQSAVLTCLAAGVVCAAIGLSYRAWYWRKLTDARLQADLANTERET